MIVAHPNYTQPGCSRGCSFTSWGYCGGLVVNGLMDVLPLLPAAQRASTADSINATLDRWASEPGQVADLLANRTIKNGPMLLNAAPAAANYLLRAGGGGARRAAMAPSSSSSSSQQDLAIVDKLCDHYYGPSYPDHLPTTGGADSITPCRSTTGGEWPEEKDDGTCKIVWADDSFMSTVLLARRAATLPPGDPRAERWLQYAVRTQRGFREHLLDPADGLYRHAFSAKDGRHSCCKWGRANGWLMASHAEILLAAHAQGDQDVVSEVATVLQDHGAAMCKQQATTTTSSKNTTTTTTTAPAAAATDKSKGGRPGTAGSIVVDDGRFHQVVNETGTFLETSVTAMMVWSLATGVTTGDLDFALFGPCLAAAWSGLAATVEAGGAVDGICMGGPIKGSVNDYNACGTDYKASACGGLGFVLRATAAMATMQEKQQQQQQQQQYEEEEEEETEEEGQHHHQQQQQQHALPSSPLPTPDYLGASIAAYEAGIHDTRHHVNRTGEQVDTWALAAALIAKYHHTGGGSGNLSSSSPSSSTPTTTMTNPPNQTWVRRSVKGLELFAEAWVNSTQNGTLTYNRSGFIGWSVPWAYAILRDMGVAPDWSARQLNDFKRACDAWLNPFAVPKASDGILELGNWNKGWQHLADAAAVLYAFPDVDEWPANAGVYRAYVNRTWASWTQQHVYPENSVNYNAISLQLLVNIIPRLVGHPEDTTHPATVAMVERYAGYFSPTGCMPAFGASNGPCESPLLFSSAFEAAAAATGDQGGGHLRHFARVLYGCNRTGCPAVTLDPISTMLAHDQMDATLPAVPPPVGVSRGAVPLRREARNQQPEPAHLPDKMVLAPAAPDGASSRRLPYAMFELWSTVSLYHEATPQIVGDLIEFVTSSGAGPSTTSPAAAAATTAVRYTRPVGRKHAPVAAQGNTVVVVPNSESAAAMFPYYGAAELVPDPARWQTMTLSTRFLQVESNDMDQYTTRSIRDLAVVCDATVAGDGTTPFDVFIYGIELVGPKGTKSVVAFQGAGNHDTDEHDDRDRDRDHDGEASSSSSSPAWSNAQLSTDIPPATDPAKRGDRSLRIHCTPNATTSSRRPSTLPKLDLTFDVVEDYSHLRYSWRTSSEGFAFPGGVDCGDVGQGCAMPVFLNTTFPVPPKDEHVGEATSGVFGQRAGGFEQSWFYPSTSTKSTSAAADAAGNTGGIATIEGLHGYGSVWQRAALLLRGSGILLVADSIVAGPPMQDIDGGGDGDDIGNSSYLVGPVFNLQPGTVDGPHRQRRRRLQQQQHQQQESITWWDTGNYSVANERLLLIMAGGMANSSICNVETGAESCRPDLAPCDKTSRGGCPNLQAFARAQAPAGKRLTFVSVLIPHCGAAAATSAEVASVTIAIVNETIVDVDVGEWADSGGGRKAHVNFEEMRWTVG
eukprot:g3947.t1